MKNINKDRLQLQHQLDATKTSTEWNKLGQFATPLALAKMIAQSIQCYRPTDAPICFLDPAFGTGAFYEALRQVYREDIIEEAISVDTGANKCWFLGANFSLLYLFLTRISI